MSETSSTGDPRDWTGYTNCKVMYIDNVWKVNYDELYNPNYVVGNFPPYQYPELPQYDLNDWWYRHYPKVWHYWFPTLPTVQEDKMTKAFNIAKSLMDNKKINIITIKDFIDMVDLIVKQL